MNAASHPGGGFTGTTDSMIAQAIMRGYAVTWRFPGGTPIAVGRGGDRWRLDVVYGADGDELAWVEQ